jgi:hypothetical protein
MLTINTQDLLQRVTEALAEKIPDAECPLCHTKEWIVQPGVTYLPLETQSQMSSSHIQRALPMVSLACGNCGNSQLLNLRILLPDLASQM